MLKHFLSILMIISYAILAAGDWQWINSFGSEGMEAPWDLAVSPAPTNAGEFYVGGEFSDSLSVNGLTYPGQGLSDCFIIKYSAQGNVMWVRTIGSAEPDVCVSIAADASGNCYFTGFYSGKLSYGGFNLTHQGTWDVLYGKFSTSGELLWLRSFGGVNSEIGYGIEATPSGEVYITGWFGGTMTFSPTLNLTSFGGSDVFLAKFDTDGTPLWARHAGTEGVEYGYKVDIGANGDNAYVTGSAGPGSNFDGIITDTQGMYVAKYDGAGNIQWVLPSYGAGALNISTDQDHITGQRNAVIGRATGIVQIGGMTHGSVGGSDDIYVAYFDETGNWTEVEYYGGTGSDKGRALDIRYYPEQREARLFTFENTINMDGIDLSAIGSADIVISAPYLAPAVAGSPNPDIATDIKWLSPDTYVVCGWFSGTMRFGDIVIGSGSDSNQDAFIAVFDQSASANDVLTESLIKPLSCRPNPATGSCTISSDLYDRVTIFNLRGQKVATLNHGVNKGDRTDFIWDGRDSNGKTCPAGIYIARAGANNLRMLLTQP